MGDWVRRADNPTKVKYTKVFCILQPKNSRDAAMNYTLPQALRYSTTPRQDFLNAVYGETKPLRGDNERLFGKTAVTLSPSRTIPDAVELSQVISSEQGKGHGTAALKRLTELADQHKVKLLLTPAPIEGTGVVDRESATNRLIDFYSRFGFEGDEEGMYRHPAGEEDE